MANLTGFSRLKNLFQGSLNLTTYREIISHTRTAECGNIPKDLSDKITARYYKKIMNQKNPELRQKYIAQLKKEIELMNDLDKEKIKKAIRLAS